MRLDIRYVTRFAYAAPVAESQNELRASPATDSRQQLVHYDVTTQPSSRVLSYIDHWGTRVDTFGIRVPHSSLEVVAEATVDTAPTEQLIPDPTWSELEDARFRDLHLEFLQRSPHADWGDAVTTEARRLREDAGTVHDTVLAVYDRVAAFDYAPGQTYVGVDVDEVFARRGGVCQDFAHLAIALYRSLGIPARYASGYLFTLDDATGVDSDEDEVHVETHAWVEVAVPGGAWVALDPTNSQPVGERHVTIGRGRDYDDVAPFRGVYSGPSDHDLEVVVSLRRLSREPSDSGPGDRSLDVRFGATPVPGFAASDVREPAAQQQQQQ